MRHTELHNSRRTKLAVSLQIRGEGRKVVLVTKHTLCRTGHIIYTSRNIRIVYNFEVFHLLGCFTASPVGSLLQTQCPETSALNCKLTLQNMSEERRPHLHSGPKPRARMFAVKPLHEQRPSCAYFAYYLFIQLWQNYIHKVPVILRNYLQRVSHKHYGPPTSVT